MIKFIEEFISRKYYTFGIMCVCMVRERRRESVCVKCRSRDSSWEVPSHMCHFLTKIEMLSADMNSDPCINAQSSDSITLRVSLSSQYCCIWRILFVTIKSIFDKLLHSILCVTLAPPGRDVTFAHRPRDFSVTLRHTTQRWFHSIRASTNILHT